MELWSFYWVCNDCKSSLTARLIYNMFLVCGIDTGLFFMVSSVVSFTAVFVLEYLSAVSGYLMAPSNFQCTDHDYVKWVELCSNYHGWLQVSACFPPHFVCTANYFGHGWWKMILCSKLWNCEIYKHMLNIVIYIRINIYLTPIN